jgi:hypothetical protein
MADKFEKIQAKRNSNPEPGRVGVKQPITPVQKVVPIEEKKSKDWKLQNKDYDRLHIILEEDIITRIKMAVATKKNGLKYDSHLLNAILADFFKKHSGNDLRTFLKDSEYAS